MAKKKKPNKKFTKKVTKRKLKNGFRKTTTKTKVRRKGRKTYKTTTKISIKKTKGSKTKTKQIFTSESTSRRSKGHFGKKKVRLKKNLINYTISGKRRTRARDAYKAYQE